MDFTKSLNNGESNTYDQTNARPSGDINLSDLFEALKEDNKKVFCRVKKPVESPSTAGNINTLGNDTSFHLLYSGNEELVNIFQSFEMEKTPEQAAKRLEDCFCSKLVFNLSKKVLTEIEIHALEKGLGCAFIPTKINETDLKGDFNEFPRKIRCKWYFRNKPNENFIEAPAFCVKSN